MATVRFTQNLQRHVHLPNTAAAGRTVREVLDAVFRDHPAARSYVLEDDGALRKHMAVFVDGNVIVDRAALSDAVGESSEIWVMQALSGG